MTITIVSVCLLDKSESSNPTRLTNYLSLVQVGLIVGCPAHLCVNVSILVPSCVGKLEKNNILLKSSSYGAFSEIRAFELFFLFGSGDSGVVAN